MVARLGGYYGKAFKGARGVTQGDPLSPTIFNVVVDAVVSHWVTMALEEAEKRGEKGNEGSHQADLFYAGDGMVAFSNPRLLQWAFDILVSLSEWVGLQKNVEKTRRYVCGLPPVAKAYQIQRSSFACPCCANRWDASDPDAISFPHSLHSTRYFCRSRYVAPPCHLPSVRRFRLCSCRLARSADHADRLLDVFLQAHPFG